MKKNDGRHWQQGRIGPLSNAWKGGTRITDGYNYIYSPDHPNAIKSGYVAKHILIVSKLLGRKVPNEVQIHHHDGDRSNNNPRNLVVCPDDSYHKLLHMRIRAKEVCGHAGWYKCRHCKKWDAPENLYVSPKWKYANHRKCQAEYVRGEKE